MKKSTIITPAVALVALFAGVGIGTSGQPEPEVVTETKTVTKEVEVTPAACVDLATYGEETFTHLGDLSQIASDGIMDAFNWDTAALNAGTTKIENLTAEIGDTRMNFDLAKAKCLAELS